jgi:hypothetical protein
MSFILSDEAMMVISKGYTALTQKMIEHIFNTDTHSTYLVCEARWYVCKYNEGHYIHYRYVYSEFAVNMRMEIMSTPDKPLTDLRW